MRYGRNSICRVKLAVNISKGDKCQGGFVNKDHNMCAPARRVLQMNDKTDI